MDNLTHSMAGWVIGQAGLKTKSRKGLAALILGANAPDIDVFFGWAPWEPLAMHRGFTHSLIGGIVILPLMLWGLLLALDRLQVSRGAEFKSGLDMRPGWLLALCYIGAITHPLLDLQTTYSVQLLSSLSGLWFHSDSLFIIDVWLWALFGLGIAWSRMREKQGRPWRRHPQAAIAVAVGYIALNLAISAMARNAVLDRLVGPKPSAMFASPPPVRFWERTLTWRQGRMIGRARYDAMDGGLESVEPQGSDNLDHPLVRRAMRQPEHRSFFGWSTMTTARVEREGCRATVIFGDARYAERQSRSAFQRKTAVQTC